VQHGVGISTNNNTNIQGGFMSSTRAGTSGLIGEAGLPFELPPGYEPGDFLYGDHGPWPVMPNPKYGDVAPEVLRCDQPELHHCIPAKESTDWDTNLGTYYKKNVYDPDHPLNFKFPFPRNAIDYAAEILGVQLDWVEKHGILAEFLGWLGTGIRPPGLLDTYLHPYPELSDDTFTKLIAHGVLSKLLSLLDEPDKKMFQSFLNDRNREFWKCDLTHMRVVRTLIDSKPQEHVAPAIVLLSRPTSPIGNYEFKVACIALFVQSQRGGPYDKTVILGPTDGEPWQLAKYFALQGALIRLNLIDHTMVHFPSDAINAITKSTLPKSNRVLQLLLPHLRLSLPVDNSVLEGKYSLLNRTWTYPYSPYPAAGDEIRKLFPFYWQGSETASESAESWALGRNNAFPPYKFRTEPRAIPSRYGTFLNAYYKPILNFATGVVKSIPTDDRDCEAISFWADHVTSWIPGFPDGKTIYKNGDLLAKTCAAIIWNGAIVHTADHWLMHQMFEQKRPTPYIMRVPPPGSPFPLEYPPTAYLVHDVFPARLCDLMFFMPHSTTLLSAFKYEFANDLGPLIEKFRKDMIYVDDEMHKQFPEFGIKLYPDDKHDPAKDCFAAGVQF
jgi:hypothetical protein